MLQSFIDDSGWDGNSPAFVLAGYIAEEKQWEEFSYDWQAVLDLEEPRKLEFLKMNEAYLLNNHNSQFYGWSEIERDERLKKFIKVISKHTLHGLISVVPIEPYQRLFAGKFSPTALNRPYFLCFFGVMARLLSLTKHLKLDYRIDFIFDTLGGESKALLVGEYEKFISLAPPDLRELSGGVPKFEREQDFKPLQAADMVAWHARRYYYDLYRGRDPTKEPSNVFFAHLFYPDHDILDIWTDQKLIEASKFVLTARWLSERQGIPMTLPDPSNPLSF